MQKYTIHVKTNIDIVKLKNINQRLSIRGPSKTWPSVFYVFYVYRKHLIIINKNRN